jgi:hypothetical protein
MDTGAAAMVLTVGIGNLNLTDAAGKMPIWPMLLSARSAVAMAKAKRIDASSAPAGVIGLARPVV